MDPALKPVNNFSIHVGDLFLTDHELINHTILSVLGEPRNVTYNPMTPKPTVTNTVGLFDQLTNPSAA